MINKIKYFLKSVYIKIRFGRIQAREVATCGDNVVCEVEYRDRSGDVVGYWACGYFDPSLPYRGET